MRFLKWFKRRKVYRGGRLRFAERLRSWLLNAVILIIVLAALSGTGWLALHFHRFLMHSEYLMIQGIVVEGEDLDPEVEQQILRLMTGEGGVIGTNLLRLNARAWEAALEQIPKAGAVSVRKRYPNEVRVQVRVRHVVALILQDPILGIDNEGVVVETLNAQDPRVMAYPFISGLRTGRIGPGSHIRSETLTKVLLLLSCLESRAPVLFGKVSEAHCGSNGDLTLLLRGGTEVRFGSVDPVSKMPDLEAFLDRMGPPEQFLYIDLRFDGQVPCKLRDPSARPSL